jgi:hypothetical protein
LAFVADNREDPIKHLIYSSGGEKPKVPDCVPIALKNVLDPEINKLFQGASDMNAFAGILILSHELNSLRLEVKVGNTALSNDRTAGISAPILKKVLNRIKGSDFDAPPAFLLGQHRFHFGNCHRRP